jgi:hypothetical protein
MKTTQKGGFSKLCVKIKKRYYTYSIFQHVYGKHNLMHLGPVVSEEQIKI